MALFCPLAEDIGTAAEWVAVGVAFLGALAVWLVSRAANSTAKAAKDIQQQEAAARAAAVAREARLLLIHLEPELRQVQSDLSGIATGLDIVEHDTFVINQHARRTFANDLESISLRLCHEHFNRWYVLPDEHALALARAVSGLEVLKTASSDVAGIDLSDTMPGVGREGWDEFRREHISSAYTLMKTGVSELSAQLVPLINAAVEEKRKVLPKQLIASPPA